MSKNMISALSALWVLWINLSTWRLSTGTTKLNDAKRNASLWVANGNDRHLHQSNTLSPWLRNSSRHADKADVRNLAGYSRRKEGNELKDNNDVTSVLCLKNPWPRMARTIYGTYYSRFMETNNQPFSKRPQGWRQFPCGSSCFGGGQLRSGATPIRISSVPAPGILSKTVFLIAEPPVQAAKRINNVKNRLKRRIFLTTKKCAAFATTTQRLLSSIEWPQLSKLWNATATKGRRENKRRIRFEKSWQEGTSWPFLKTLDIIHYFLF
ncbi:uncharacterized protein LOC124316496 isoform X1 [Daphnia pulicaria]|uniref:uncharacterized protein LOC124316496 isoform X1 n=1 Tax=Daphnia pulicaria TaxID=35523 RepID=UPI001EEA6234|nr:uncharacterized protein LOC124316496 isoform X1 [Daphnia pulicaria]XP_046638436.1 uncharacterized protein LOC124316496 isoform X1 [Daphnia pulicaria]XP_046638437.1 uncharacterized protein LOC124316496 isoform X1 [Daphnia pulicaria]